MKIEFNKVDNVSLEYKDNHFVNVTEWVSGEGVDLSFNDDKTISLHYDEIHAINIVVGMLLIGDFPEK